MSVAMALIARPMVAGAWGVVVEAPMFGLEAAAEHGVPLTRLVRVDAGTAGDWADRIVAAAAGFEMIVTCPPPGAERHVRRVQHRLHSAGSVMFVVAPESTSMPCDVVVDTTSVTWDGLGVGHGHLCARRVVLGFGGRRVPRPIRHEMWLPTDRGRVAAVEPVGDVVREPARVDGRPALVERAG